MNPFALTTSAVSASLASAGGVMPFHCNHCGTPVAEIAGGMLIIRNKHHGEQHVTILNLISLASGLKLI